MENRPSIIERCKRLFIGEARNPLDQTVFHNISLIAFFAWVGLGADGLSSSCYGPSEAFITLGQHYFLGIIVALLTAFTIFIISESYSQVVELFPTGGGGYMVASSLLSPRLGMLSGCALLVDYVLTITLSIASGADALFSFLPQPLLTYKLPFAVAVLAVMIVLNLRGVKESVLMLFPIFMLFVITHAFIILYALFTHMLGFGAVVSSTAMDIKTASSELGLAGMFILIMRAYSMGAGTYTGIEAVSNGLPILREPKVKTAKQTMKYMVISLASIVLGLMFAYTLYRVQPQFGKTLNAVLFENVTAGWGLPGYIFILITLFSEGAILFVAAQTGLIGGPRVLANMAADRWLPKRFALLSDRLVTMNGILIMGIGSIILMISTNGSVSYLVVLYSINVFITFCLTQLGLVKHWLGSGEDLKTRLSKLSVTGIGLIATTFILISVTVLKFHDGGWITLLITGVLFVFMSFIKLNYEHTDRLINKLNVIVKEVESTFPVQQIPLLKERQKAFDPNDKTAVIIVKDFTGVGLKTLFSIFKSFGRTFKNFVFVQVGLIDSSAFRGTSEMEKVKKKVEYEINRYKYLLERHGYHVEGVCLYGIDTVEEVAVAAKQILERYHNATFFGGQIVFPRQSFLPRILHNYTLFSVQQRLYNDGIPLFILPIELTPTAEYFNPLDILRTGL